jgi:hypothetical protein
MITLKYYSIHRLLSGRSLMSRGAAIGGGMGIGGFDGGYGERLSMHGGAGGRSGRF